MSGGTVTIEAGEDGIDCNREVKITGGSLMITAGESGIEAAGADISDCTVTISANKKGDTGDANPALLINGAGKLTLGSNMVILNPAGGTVGTVKIDDTTYATILDADGKYATEVKLVDKTTDPGISVGIYPIA